MKIYGLLFEFMSFGLYFSIVYCIVNIVAIILFIEYAD